MYFTSVRGHMMNYDFSSEFQEWRLEKIIELYSAQINKLVTDDCKKIKLNLENLARNVDTLILWLDCDREGENICFEVIDVVRSINRNVRIFRAKFSALTRNDILNAINNLEYPNENLSNAVEIRQKIDLIIGASFTRLQSI